MLVSEADRKLKELNVQVQKAIFDVFKTRYGTENDAYWNKMENGIIPVNEGGVEKQKLGT